MSYAYVTLDHYYKSYSYYSWFKIKWNILQGIALLAVVEHPLTCTLDQVQVYSTLKCII